MQLLSTNTELLSYIFDKMFKNTKKPRDPKAKDYSQADILEALLASQRSMDHQSSGIGAGITGENSR